MSGLGAIVASDLAVLPDGLTAVVPVVCGYEESGSHALGYC